MHEMCFVDLIDKKGVLLMNSKIKKEATNDLIKQLIGMLSALLPLLAILGISQSWFNEEFISSLQVFLVALIPFVYNLYSIYNNHFSGKKAQAQKRVLKEKGLK